MRAPRCVIVVLLVRPAVGRGGVTGKGEKDFDQGYFVCRQFLFQVLIIACLGISEKFPTLPQFESYSTFYIQRKRELWRG